MGSVFTDRESQLMAIAWQCFSEQPKINFDKMAGLAGYTNTKSCSNAWSAIKKKLAAEAEKVTGGANGDANGDAPKPKATPRKRAKKAADEDGADGEAPAKKAKTTQKKRGGKKATAEVEEEDKDDEAAGEEEKAAVKDEQTDELV
ncbi:hypothetical protein CLAFUW4_00425 [Fulvia fulva]|uniref:Myb-like domain-containing protein n=1 Tax=Passalora fulva TaxID=5499 RepID=A0A9Q8P3K8_PASFU|nr:uncharacterized protein CLAFUR5_00427 [Fulvia fulva]KAK4636217.1 hypothetical protein CLAFUR4_00425 [Fulvia fulva]KAK4637087.1 hypothetical protein CLAFUR0_00426 [Fulvia fulva]UJO11909.1 hypothetical protein CLAFUR5_00427 [Fulvia fulva]WPV09240.1 hypothetical protein CLAFUW4_00425 [Fulvia fulva]WPV24334.1 hypothetical protein CLAFUW7_00429 [Fulvia fulva]